MTPEQWLAAGNVPEYYSRTPTRQKKWGEMDENQQLQEAVYEIDKLKQAGQFNPSKALEGVYSAPTIQEPAPVVQQPVDPCAQFANDPVAYRNCQSSQAAGGMNSGMGTGLPTGLMEY